jgi:hypothetical protein
MNRSILLGNERMTALKDTIKSLQDRSDCISMYCMSVCMYVLSHCVYVCVCMCVYVTRINMDNSKQCKLCSIDLLQKYCVLRYKADLSAYRRQALENNWQRHWVRTIHTYIHTYTARIVSVCIVCMYCIVCVCYIFVCIIFVCIMLKLRKITTTHTYIHTYIYIYNIWQ